MLWTIVSVIVGSLILGWFFYFWGWEDGMNRSDRDGCES